MLLKEKLRKYKNHPLTVIIRGGNFIGVEIAHSLMEQEGIVIMVDDFTHGKEDLLKELKENKFFSFVDISGVYDLFNDLDHLDYVIFFSNDTLSEEEHISTQVFLARSKLLDASLELSVRHSAKFLLASSIRGHQLIMAKREMANDITLPDDHALGYTNIETQRYAESLTWEYMKKSNLDGRIIRLGEVIGEGMDFDKNNTIFAEFIKNAVDGKKITVIGDGLERLFFIHLIDAAYGLIKSLFSKEAKGEIYSLHLEEDITVLSLAYKIQDLAPNAKSIEFKDAPSSRELNIYKPARNLSAIGWKPKISFERAIAQTIDYIYDLKNGSSKKQEKDIEKQASLGENEDADKETEKESADVEPVEQREHSFKEKKGVKSKRSVKDRIIDFFFETVEQDNQTNGESDSVLDNLMHKDHPEKVPTKIPSVKKASHKQRLPSTLPQTSSLRTLIAYSITIILGLFLYITFLLPSFRFVYFLHQGSSEFSHAIEVMENDQEYNDSLLRASNHFAEAESNFDQVKWVLQAVTLGDEKNNIGQSLDTYQEITSIALSYSSESANKLETLVHPFEIDSNNILSLKEIQVEDYADALSSYRIISEGTNRLQIIEQDLNEIDFTIGWLNTINTRAVNYTQILINENGVKYPEQVVETLVGGNRGQTIFAAVIPFDSDKPLPGETTGYIMVTFSKGAPVSLDTGVLDSSDIKLSETERDYVESKLVNGSSDDITWTQLAQLDDLSLYYDTIQASIGDLQTIDTFILFDTDAVTTYIQQVEAFMFNGTEASSDDVTADYAQSPDEYTSAFVSSLVEHMYAFDPDIRPYVERELSNGSIIVYSNDPSISTSEGI